MAMQSTPKFRALPHRLYTVIAGAAMCATSLAGCGDAQQPACTSGCIPNRDFHELALLAGEPGGPGVVDGSSERAHFQGPYGIAYDGEKHVYLADDSLIRDIDLESGTVRTIAGQLTIGSSDGVGEQAAFFRPGGMVVVDGKVLVTDTENHSLRQIDPDSGEVTTIVGQAGVVGHNDAVGTDALTQEPEGLAWDRSARELYFSDTDNHTIRKLDLESRMVTTVAGEPTQSGTADGLGAAARFSRPKALAFDDASRALFISDSTNMTVRKLELASGRASTLASLPIEASCLAVHDGDVLACVGAQILGISASSGEMREIAGSSTDTGFADGTGSAVLFATPMGLATDGQGGVFIADPGEHAVRKLEVDSGAVTTLAGASSAGSVDATGSKARFFRPQSLVAAGEGTLYVADTENHAIRKLSVATGKVTTFAGALGEAGHVDANGGSARFDRPSGLALDAGRYLYVAELGNKDLRRIDLASRAVTTLELASRNDAVELAQPVSIALEGEHLYVTEATRVLVVDLATKKISVLAKDPGSNRLFAALAGVVADGAGHLLIADMLKNSILRLTVDTGEVTTFVGAAGWGDERLYYPTQLALRTDGVLFAIDSHTVREIRMDGSQMRVVAGKIGRQGLTAGRLPAQLGEPTALALTDEGTLAIADENSIVVVR
jgi:sugar lactone lactonase YvrE